MKNSFKVIGFDADDTLWVNEPYFRESEIAFAKLLCDFATEEVSFKTLYQTEMDNLALYGFGAKSFMLSMVETALKISDHKVSTKIIEQIIELGKEQINKPVVLLDGVEKVLHSLKGKGQTLIVATKGDLLDQERKLAKSNIAQYFHHVEIMSNKKESDYEKLLAHLEITPEEFLMIGNSMKSDILPVINLGGYGIHVPYHTTWIHEEVDEVKENGKFRVVEKLEEVLSFFST